MGTHRRERCALLIGLLTASLLSGASAQSYPDKPIRIIVSIAAGSVTDVVMRAATNELAPRLGQPLVIENRGGASGILGAQACAQAAPDGYTFCTIYHSTTSYNPLLFDKLPYDADTDFLPVIRLFMLTEGLFVSSALGVNSVSELKTLAQSKPDALNFATLGDGSFPDLFRVWLNNQWGTRIVGVPYKGGGPAAQALLAGEVQVTRFGVGNFMGGIQSGKVRALAIHADKRSTLLPDVPTFVEAGFDYPGQGWWGLAAPRGTPASAIARINEEFVRLFEDPKFIAHIERQSVVAAPTTPEEFAKFLREDRKTAEGLIKIAKTPRTDFREHP
jgi:tripartite-type tricarboxylate transporter receptor subunit TctC